MNASAPVLMEIAIEPRLRADAARLQAALGPVLAAHPDATFATEPESGQTILGGMSEVALDALVDDLLGACDFPINIGAPEVAYRETITRRAEIDHSYSRINGSGSEFARVRILFEPAAPGAGFEFAVALADNAVPLKFIPGVLDGLSEGLRHGLLAGFPLIDLKATLVDGAHHDIDSSIHAFGVAARQAMRKLNAEGAPVLLEPVMKLSVTSPRGCADAVVADLNSRRGRGVLRKAEGEAAVINALAPLSNLFGYVNTLRGMTQGQADFSMEFDHYAPVYPDGGPGAFPQAAAKRA